MHQQLSHACRVATYRTAAMLSAKMWSPVVQKGDFLFAPIFTMNDRSVSEALIKKQW
jgi:hypothetical protein